MNRRTMLAAALMFAALPAIAQDRPALLNPNSAAEAEIASMPHVTPDLAKTIVAQRPLSSPKALDDVLAAGGLSEEQRKQSYTRMFVPLNLNTASTDDIMLIPGMTPRMAAEFREYRPYRQIGQFRFEIGKYVPKTEVARLERYVFVPPK